MPGKFHGWRSLVGYSPWGCKELDMIEWLYFHFSDIHAYQQTSLECLSSEKNCLRIFTIIIVGVIFRNAKFQTLGSMLLCVLPPSGNCGMIGNSSRWQRRGLSLRACHQDKDTGSSVAELGSQAQSSHAEPQPFPTRGTLVFVTSPC